jgi:hypothetical protein
MRGPVVDDWVAQKGFETVRRLLHRLRDGRHVRGGRVVCRATGSWISTRARILSISISVDDAQPVGLNALVADGVPTEKSRLEMASIFFQNHRLSDAQGALAPL